MRDYTPIWNKLKREKKVLITANPRLHARIIKAVTKEKWMDLAYKIQIEPKIAITKTEIKGSIITFTLRETLNWERVTVGEF